MESMVKWTIRLVASVIPLLSVSATVLAEQRSVSQLIEGSYFVMFTPESGLIDPPVSDPNHTNPFDDHPLEQSEEELTATLGITGEVVNIFQGLGAAHILTSAAEAEWLARQPYVQYVEQDSTGTVAGGSTTTAPAAEGSITQPTYIADHLLIPAVDTDSQVAAYQNAIFARTSSGLWRLLTFNRRGSSTLQAAPVDDVEPTVTDAFPTQVFLRISGQFSSGCGSIGRISHRLEENHFTVVVSAEYSDPEQYACTAAIRPFRKSWPLPVYGLPAGTYTYDLNGVTGSFELTEENVMPGDCGVENGDQCPSDIS